MKIWKIIKYYLVRYRRYIYYLLNRLGLRKAAKENLLVLKQNKSLIKDFKQSIKQMAAFIHSPISDFINSYKNKTVKPIKIADFTAHNEPILICAVKNDLIKVKKQIEHHRKIGIKHFTYIDNMSDDGTFEWLMTQDDVSLFLVDETFNATIKNAWRRQITDFFGYDRWYLILDSDEFFYYPGIESKPISEYIDFLEKEKIKCAHTPMIDMYSDERLFDGTSDSFLDEYCYFDPDSYSLKQKFWGFSIMGGPRSRLFGEIINDKAQLLTKYSLIKAEIPYLVNTHINFPFKLNFSNKRAIAFLLHYKFLPTDIARYHEIIKDGTYFQGSKYYKLFMEAYNQDQTLSFYYEKSVKLSTSMDLLQLNIVDRKFFNKFLQGIEVNHFE